MAQLLNVSFLICLTTKWSTSENSKKKTKEEKLQKNEKHFGDFHANFTGINTVAGTTICVYNFYLL